MSGIDVLILVIIGFAAVNGLRRGFLLGIADLVALAAALLVGARLTGWVAQPLSDNGIPDPLSGAAGYFLAAVVSYAVIGLAIRILLSPLRRFGQDTPFAWVNGVLGLIPGAIRGTAFAAIAVIALTAMPVELGMASGLAESRFAAPLTTLGRTMLGAGLTWTGVDPAALGLPEELVSTSRDRLPFAGVTEVEQDPAAEALLLELLNQERFNAGLPPLVADATLAGVGRRHGREMFELGFFSHESPTGGNLTERLEAAGLDLVLSGENIALAPSPELAHEGLMNSPAYRANILNPGYTRVGISALRSKDHGLMVTQNFGG